MEQTTEYREAKGNRNVKSSLFPKVFEDKKELLELFNAVNGTNYQDSDDLEINTIEGILYMTTKNDMSFLMDCTMNLYEQQSTYNPNMPLRGFMYFGQLYHKYIKTRGLNIYSSKLQKIPVPHYVVFYNGTKEEPDEKILLLSDAFQREFEGNHTHGCLECEVRMLNINYGHNKALMEKCTRLEEYAIFIENILKDFLIEQRSEVLDMVLYSFDKELYEKDLKQTAYDEGGHDKLMGQVKKKLEKKKSVEEIADALEETVETIQKIVNEIQQTSSETP